MGYFETYGLILIEKFRLNSIIVMLLGVIELFINDWLLKSVTINKELKHEIKL